MEDHKNIGADVKSVKALIADKNLNLKIESIHKETLDIYKRVFGEDYTY